MSGYREAGVGREKAGSAGTGHEPPRCSTHHLSTSPSWSSVAGPTHQAHGAGALTVAPDETRRRMPPRHQGPRVTATTEDHGMGLAE